MNFSLFSNNDDTFGQISGVKRAVVLKGKTTVSNWVSPNVFDVRDDIANALRADGFEVIAVKWTGDSWIGYEINLEIEVNVYTDYSAEQVRQRAIQVIESITRTFGTTIKLFWNTSLQVKDDALWRQGGNNNQQGNNNQLPNNIPPPKDDDSSDIWKKFFENAGLTTPVALVGGALLLILIMRR